MLHLKNLKLFSALFIFLLVTGCSKPLPEMSDTMAKSKAITYCSAITEEAKSFVRNAPLYSEAHKQIMQNYLYQVAPLCTKKEIPYGVRDVFKLERILKDIQRLLDRMRVFHINEHDLL